MTRPRLVLAVLLGACNSSPNLAVLDQNVFAAPDDPLVTFDNAAHPQIVGIQKFSGGKCTGTIIASNKVLTAAHCFGLNTPASNVDVLLDRNTSEALQDSLLALGDPAIHNDTNGLTWEVASIAIHPAWSSNDDFDVDIAVLTMQSAIPPALITPLPVLADILPAPFIGGQEGYDKWVAYYADFFGVGNDSADCQSGAFSPATIIAEEIFDTVVGPNGGIGIVWSDDTWAGSKTCPGDSGGPFVTSVADYIGANNIPPGFVMGVLFGGGEGGTALGPLFVSSNRTFVAQQALDADGDGFEVGVDTCDKQSNPDQSTVDTDGDGWPDMNCDDDDDNDGVDDIFDNCDLVENPNQANLDNDAAGDACDWDDDGDWVADGDDNCKLIANPFQQNCNADAEALGFAGSSPSIELGDACDPVPCAPADTDVREFIVHKNVFWGNAYAVCVDQYGRLYEDIVDVLGRVAAGNAAVNTTQLEAWFCGCEDDTLAECAAPPWSCGLSPTAGTANGSRWRKLSLAQYANPAVAVPQPLAATFSPWNALPQSTLYRWNYQQDFVQWVQTEQLWTPTPNDPATYGAGTDMKGVLWLEDPTSVGLSAHSAGGCSGPSCSMASSYLVDAAPDRAAVFTMCNDVPELAPAPWWTYCPMCDDLFTLPSDSVSNPEWISAIGDHVRLFSKQFASTRGVVNGAAKNVTSLFSRGLVDALATAKVVGASDSNVMLQPGMARAIALSSDGSRLLGQVFAGSAQFELRALANHQGVSPRSGFAVAYSLLDGGLRLAGGIGASGLAMGDYWRWTPAAGWTQLDIATTLAPKSAVSSVFGGDRALWVIDRRATLTLIRVDEATSTGGTGTLAMLDQATEAWLFVLADGNVALATSANGRYQLSRLAWGSEGVHVEATVEYSGELGGAPYATGGNIAVPLRLRTRSGVGIGSELVPAQVLAPRMQ